eukprot:scpid102249/ scgid20417/ 
MWLYHGDPYFKSSHVPGRSFRQIRQPRISDHFRTVYMWDRTQILIRNGNQSVDATVALRSYSYEGQIYTYVKFLDPALPNGESCDQVVFSWHATCVPQTGFAELVLGVSPALKFRRWHTDSPIQSTSVSLTMENALLELQVFDPMFKYKSNLMHVHYVNPTLGVKDGAVFELPDACKNADAVNQPRRL